MTFSDIKTLLAHLNTLQVVNFGYQTPTDIVGGTYKFDGVVYENSIPDPILTGFDEFHQDFSMRTNATYVLRMLINHLFGRMSFNTNKLVEELNSLINDHLINRYFSNTMTESASITQTSDAITMTLNNIDVLSGNITPEIIQLPIVDDLNPGFITEDDKAMLQEVRTKIDLINGMLLPGGTIKLPISFLDLLDTPDLYVGHENNFVLVNETADGIIFDNMSIIHNLFLDGEWYLNGEYFLSGFK